MELLNVKKALTNQDIQNFENLGYIVVKNAVSDSLAHDLAEFMLWYQKECNSLSQETQNEYAEGIVRMVHHPLQWKLRESPIIYLAFSQLLKEHKLWVTLDRGKIVPPASFNGNLQKGFIHWDINTKILPENIPFQGLQGLVALTDTKAGQGGFQCVPGFHLEFYKWRKLQPLNRDPFRPDLKGMRIEEVEMRAGDLVIWNSLLPHGNGPNLTNVPRIAQFVRMFPCNLQKKDTLQQRLDMWKNKLPYNDSNLLNCYEPKLSPLGKRLLGLCSW